MLSETEQAQFDHQGFLVVENVISATKIDAVKAEYAARMDELFATWQQQGLIKAQDSELDFWAKLDQCRAANVEWFQPLDISLPHEDIREDTPMHLGPAIFDIVIDRGILDRVESLLGPELSSNPIQHVRIKPPEREAPVDEIRAHIVSTAWHQDRGVGLEEADNTDMVTVWVAITDATLENGCLQVLPGAHQSMLPHCPKKQTTIADGHLALEKAEPVPVKAGGIVMLHPLTPHSSLANQSDHYRWSFDLRYNVTGQATGRAQFPDFIARSRTQPESVLEDWRQWDQLWRDARHQVANMPHIPQHRWRADSPGCA